MVTQIYLGLGPLNVVLCTADAIQEQQTIPCVRWVVFSFPIAARSHDILSTNSQARWKGVMEVDHVPLAACGYWLRKREFFFAHRERHRFYRFT